MKTISKENIGKEYDSLFSSPVNHEVRYMIYIALEEIHEELARGLKHDPAKRREETINRTYDILNNAFKC